MLASIKTAIRQSGIRLVVIDYLQKFSADIARDKKTEDLAEVVGKLQKLARESGIAVIALAQLNRESEKDKKPRKPRMSDLRESGAIEQDADTIVAIHREDHRQSGEAELCVIKQRDGECGDVKVHYEGKFCRFSNLQPDIDHSAK